MPQIFVQAGKKLPAGDFRMKNQLSTTFFNVDDLAKSPNCPVVISTNGRNLNSAKLLRKKISR
jgi:hypothetical protein